MNKKIICQINPSLIYQHIAFYEDNKKQTDEIISMDELVPYLLDVCYKEGYYNLHFIGNQSYVNGIIENFNYQEQTKYNDNKITIEVN